MEFVGNHQERKVDKKRRVCLPEKLLQGTELFVPFVESENELRLYPYEQWKAIQERMDEQKNNVFLRSTRPIQKIDNQKRFLLPIECKWQVVDVVGMIEYISIIPVKKLSRAIL